MELVTCSSEGGVVPVGQDCPGTTWGEQEELNGRRSESDQRFSTFFISRHINELLKFCSTPQNIFFGNLTKKKKGITVIHSHQMAIVTAVATFLADKLRKKKSVPLTN